MSSQWWASNGHTLPHSLCTSSLCTPMLETHARLRQATCGMQVQKKLVSVSSEVMKSNAFQCEFTEFTMNSMHSREYIQVNTFKPMNSSLWIQAYETFYNDCNAIKVIGCGECMKHLRISLLSNLRVWRGPARSNNHWLDCLSSSSLDNDGTGVFIWRSAGKKVRRAIRLPNKLTNLSAGLSERQMPI